MPPLFLAIDTSVSRSPQISCQQLINVFTEKQGQFAKSQAPLFGVPGLRLFSTVGNGPHRGSWEFQSQAYVVSGQRLYLVDLSGAATDVSGTVNILGGGPVSMSDNGVQLIIVNGTGGWIYTPAGGLVVIGAAGFFPSDTVTYMDGYFILLRKGTNEWFISGLFDGLSYNPLDFANAEALPGTVTAAVQNLQLLFIFCSGHIELYYDAGSSPFPFARYSGGVIDYGCVSPYTVIKQDGAIFFLGRDHIFYRLQANVPIRVSTHEIETIIANDPDITIAECATYSEQGHKMIVLTLPGSMRTLEFDISTGKWHERESYNERNQPLGRWRGRTVLAIYDQNLVGDAFDGRLGAIDWDLPDEYGNLTPMVIITAPYHQDRKRVFCYGFELDVEAGVGLTTGQGSDPMVLMRYSKDGGKTWSTVRKPRSMGKIGEYGKRLRWLRLGVGRTWVFWLIITDPVLRTIIAGHGHMKVGTA